MYSLKVCLNELVRSIRTILDRPDIESSTVLLSDITPSAFQVLVEYFTGPIIQKEFNAIKEEINFKILHLMEELKIELAGASHEIRVATLG